MRGLLISDTAENSPADFIIFSVVVLRAVSWHAGSSGPGIEPCPLQILNLWTTQRGQHCMVNFIFLYNTIKALNCIWCPLVAEGTTLSRWWNTFCSTKPLIKPEFVYWIRRNLFLLVCMRKMKSLFSFYTVHSTGDSIRCGDCTNGEITKRDSLTVESWL